MLPNGSLKIIDRKKHLIKLSQGEYVALEHLEKVYGITTIVEDVIILHLNLFIYVKMWRGQTGWLKGHISFRLETHDIFCTKMVELT